MRAQHKAMFLFNLNFFTSKNLSAQKYYELLRM